MPGKKFVRNAEQIAEQGPTQERIAQALSEAHNDGFRLGSTTAQRNSKALCIAELMLEEEGLREAFRERIREETVTVGGHTLSLTSRKCAKEGCPNPKVWDGRCHEHQPMYGTDEPLYSEEDFEDDE